MGGPLVPYGTERRHTTMGLVIAVLASSGIFFLLGGLTTAVVFLVFDRYHADVRTGNQVPASANQAVPVAPQAVPRQYLGSSLDDAAQSDIGEPVGEIPIIPTAPVSSPHSIQSPPPVQSPPTPTQGRTSSSSSGEPVPPGVHLEEGN